MLLELAIVGAFASLLVQLLKQAGTSKLFSVAVLLVVSLVLAVGAWAIQEGGYWEWFLGILATANLVYSFIFKQLEDGWDDFVK